MLEFKEHHSPTAAAHLTDSLALGKRGVYHVKQHNQGFEVHHTSHGKTSEYIGSHKTREGAIKLANKHDADWDRHDKQYSSQHSEQEPTSSPSSDYLRPGVGVLGAPCLPVEKTEQFSERTEGEFSTVLKKYGYKSPQYLSIGSNLHQHPKGHIVETNGSQWSHREHKPRGKIKGGIGAGSLESHLASFHSS